MGHLHQAHLEMRYGALRRLGAAKALMLLAGVLGASPAYAQADGETPPGPAVERPFCAVQESDLKNSDPDAPKTLMALCGRQAVLLGAAEEYSVSANERLGAILVDLRRGESRRVLLVSVQGEGQPLLLEDISGQIAMEAGKGPMSPIDDVEIDTAGFAAEGAIALQGGDAGTTIQLGEQLAEARAHIAAGAEQ